MAFITAARAATSSPLSSPCARPTVFWSLAVISCRPGVSPTTTSSTDARRERPAAILAEARVVLDQLPTPAAYLERVGAAGAGAAVTGRRHGRIRRLAVLHPSLLLLGAGAAYQPEDQDAYEPSEEPDQEPDPVFQAVFNRELAAPYSQYYPDSQGEYPYEDHD